MPERALRLGVSMAALQASIGALNDLVDAPADAGHKPAQADPGRPGRAEDRRSWSSPRARAWASAWRRPSGRVSCSSRVVVLADRRTATTSSRRERPGRGCRSRSASRSCRSTAGSARPASCRRRSRSWSRGRRCRRRPGDRQCPRRPRARRAAGTGLGRVRLGRDRAWLLHARLWVVVGGHRARLAGRRGPAPALRTSAGRAGRPGRGRRRSPGRTEVSVERAAGRGSSEAVGGAVAGGRLAVGDPRLTRAKPAFRRRLHGR